MFRRSIASSLLMGAVTLNASSGFAQVSPTAFTTGFRYDAAGRLVGQIKPDPDGAGSLHYAATRNSYDAAGRLVRVETGELATWQSEAVAPSAWTGFTIANTLDRIYDGFDNPISESVSSGGVVYTMSQFSYNGERLLDCTAVRMNPETFASEPGACALGTAGSQGNDRITRNTYDFEYHLLQVTRGYGTSLQQNYQTFTYSPNGQRISEVDAKGNKSTFVYDGFDRLIQWNFPSPSAAGQINAADHEAYGYDSNGNRTSLTKRDGRQILFQYDALNRMSLKDEPGTAGDVKYGYDLDGHQLTATFVTGGQGIANTYDFAGRLLSAATNVGGTNRMLSYQYDPDGDRTRVTYPDSTYFTYVYDGLDRPTAIQQSGSTTIATETWDAFGRRSGETRGSVSIGYGYDPISRLSSLSNDLAGTAQDVTTSFTYSPASQVATETRSNDSYAWTGAVNVNRAYTANGLNQYATIAGAAQSYDANGNMLSGGGITYGYDIDNRLVSASNGVSLAYDPLGRLAQTSGGSSGTTQFLYDGDALVAEYNGSGALLRRYVHGNDSDDPMLWYEGAGLSDLRSLQVDDQGSVVSIASATGGVINLASYDEYGIPGSSNQGRFQYTGQAWLPDLGFYYYKARIYSPTLGRFLQTDPIGYKDNTNIYAYVANDPVNHTDPTGNESGTFSNGCMGDSCMNIDPGGKVHEGALSVLGTIATVGSIFVPVEGIAIKGLEVAGKLLGIGEKAAPLAGRVQAIHGALDPIAAGRRTTAAMDTAEGTRVIASGGRDLTPAQRAAMAPGEVAAKSPGAHAEVTALDHAAQNGLTPSRMSVSRDICSNCATRIQQSGGQLIDPRTAMWPK